MELPEYICIIIAKDITYHCLKLLQVGAYCILAKNHNQSSHFSKNYIIHPDITRCLLTPFFARSALSRDLMWSTLANNVTVWSVTVEFVQCDSLHLTACLRLYMALPHAGRLPPHFVHVSILMYFPSVRQPDL